MAVIMLQSIPSFYAKISEKRLFISATTYEKYLLHLSTRGLSVYTFQVSIQWKSYCKEWTSVCNEQLTLITETREWTECRALQKRDS